MPCTYTATSATPEELEECARKLTVLAEKMRQDNQEPKNHSVIRFGGAAGQTYVAYRFGKYWYTTETLYVDPHTWEQLSARFKAVREGDFHVADGFTHRTHLVS